MWLILLEMLMALGLGIFIVWWTMFHRPKSADAQRSDPLPDRAAASKPVSSTVAPTDDSDRPPQP